MSRTSELRIHCPAERGRPKAIRHAVTAFLDVFNVAEDARADISTAVGEALINVVEHAYVSGDSASIELVASFTDADTLLVEVRDRGTFKPRASTDDERGFGLRVIEAIAEQVSIDVADGTSIRMQFAAPPRATCMRIA